MSALGPLNRSSQPYPQFPHGVQTLAKAGHWALCATLLCASPWAHAQDGGPAPTADRKVRLHVGALDAMTPAGRSLAADVATLAARAARARPSLDVSADPPETWQNPDLLRHEGELLKCLNPWATRPQVLTCLDAITFPRTPPAPPEDALYLVEGTVASSEAGLVVSLSLFPMLDGKQGPAMVTRQLTVTGRLRRPAREKALTAMMDALWDAALGKVSRPRGNP